MAYGPHQEKDFKTKFYKDIMPMVYGIGAAIVIAGAMFKLLNWPGGGLMLGLGLTTEAVIFLLSAFEPKEKELDWTKVYPELLDDHQGGGMARTQAQGPVGEKLEEMFAQANIDSALIERLGQGMHQLSDAATSLGTITNLAGATEKYVENVEKASSALEGIYEAQAGAVGAMHKLISASQDTQDYQEQVQNMTETLSALNIAYKKELQEIDQRAQATQGIHSQLADSAERMQAASSEIVKFDEELVQLSQKIAALNSIYGNMLNALKS